MAAKKKKPTGKGSRGSAKPGKRKAPTKEEQVEVKVGGKEIESLLVGNMPKIRDLTYHLDTIGGWMAKAKTAQGKVSDAKKKAKEAGVDVGALMTIMRMRRMDPTELATELRQQAAMMAEVGLPVQMKLFEPAFGSVEEKAAAEGWADGKADRVPNTARWPEGAPGHVEYMRRWNDGTRDNTEKRVTGGSGVTPGEDD